MRTLLIVPVLALAAPAVRAEAPAASVVETESLDPKTSADLQAFKAKVAAANPGMDIVKVEADVVRRAVLVAPPPPPKTTPVMAIFVKNNTKTRGMDDEVDGIRDRLAAEVSGHDFAVMDSAEIGAAFNRYKITTAEERAGQVAGLFTGGSVTRIAQMLGADYILTASINGASAVGRKVGDDDHSGDGQVTVYTLRVSTKVMDATSGASVWGVNWKNKRPTSAGGDAMAHYNDLVDMWVEEVGENMDEVRGKWRPPTAYDGALASFTVSTTLDDVFTPLAATVDASKPLKEEIREGRVICEDEPPKIYLRSLYYSERDVAERVKTILSTPRSGGAAGTVNNVDNAIAWWEKRAGFSLAPKQRDALENSLRSKFSVITGGPGVGKTTIIRALVEIYSAKKLKTVLAAPTGRAAKRMTESIFGAAVPGAQRDGAAEARSAQTIHRLLKWNPVTNRFTYDAENRYEADVFIFDETSMIDVKLAADLLKALPDAATVVWVGDTDQLPSVGAGNVLRDIIDSDCVPVVRLTRIFRQAQGSLIVSNAHVVNEGHAPALPCNLTPQGEDFCFVQRDDAAAIQKDIVTLVSDYIPAQFDFHRTDIQVLSPMRKGPLGTEELNRIMTDAIEDVLAEEKR